MRYIIALVDDKDYWITQVKASIPSFVNYDFFYFESYQVAIWTHFNIVLLDYYLDKDGVRWTDIFSKLSYDILIWFSSVRIRSEEIKNNWWDYSVVKLKSNKNNELEKVFEEIFIEKKV